MRITDKQETMAWLSEKGLVDSKGMLTFTGFLSPSRFMVPVDSGTKTALSRVIASFFDSQDDSLLWIDEFGIWPSAEDRTLFEGFRQSLNEYSPLYEKPGHIFSNKDLEVVKSLIAMVLYFCWGAVIISTTKNLIFRISHDEIIDIYAKSEDDFSVIHEKLSHFMGQKIIEKIIR